MIAKMISEPIPLTGPVKINRFAVVENFGDCKIVQHGSHFRLHDESGSVTLSHEDALWIIDVLSLGASRSPMMRRVVVWEN